MSDAKNQPSKGPAGPAPSYVDALIAASGCNVRAERREAEGMAPEQVRARHLATLREYFTPEAVLWAINLFIALGFAGVAGICYQSNFYTQAVLFVLVAIALCASVVTSIVRTYKELYDSGRGMLVLGKDLLKYTDNVMSEDRGRILRIPEVLAKDDEQRHRYAAAYLAMMDIQEMYHGDPDVRTALATYWLKRVKRFVQENSPNAVTTVLKDPSVEDTTDIEFHGSIDPKKSN
jgi:hypothetical protein